MTYKYDDVFPIQKFFLFNRSFDLKYTSYIYARAPDSGLVGLVKIVVKMIELVGIVVKEKERERYQSANGSLSSNANKKLQVKGFSHSHILQLSLHFHFHLISCLRILTHSNTEYCCHFHFQKSCLSKVKVKRLHHYHICTFPSHFEILPSHVLLPITS